MEGSDATFRISKNIAKIKQRMREYPDLQNAHHFGYDHRLEFGSARVDYVVMGLNPGETKEDKKRHQAPPPGEETSEFDFHAHLPSPAKISWLNSAEFYCGSRNIAFTNCFFWSSRDDKEMRSRYQADEHFAFCAELNRDLIEIHRPKAVIFTGISYTNGWPHVPKLYKLNGPKITERETGGRDRLFEVYDDGTRPWIITKHWHAKERAIADADKLRIRRVISDVVGKWWQ